MCNFFFRLYLICALAGMVFNSFCTLFFFFSRFDIILCVFFYSHLSHLPGNDGLMNSTHFLHVFFCLMHFYGLVFLSLKNVSAIVLTSSPNTELSWRHLQLFRVFCCCCCCCCYGIEIRARRTFRMVRFFIFCITVN